MGWGRRWGRWEKASLESGEESKCCCLFHGDRLGKDGLLWRACGRDRLDSGKDINSLLTTQRVVLVALPRMQGRAV